MSRANGPGGRRHGSGAASLALLVLLSLILAGCGGDDGDPTPVPGGTATAAAADAPSAPTNVPLGSPPASLGGVVVADVLCQARLPAGWIPEGGGNGSTPSGQRVQVFGNRVTDDAQWLAATGAFKSQVERAGAAVEEGEGWVRATYPEERGVAYRARSADRWCDVRLTARRGSVPEGELAAWPAIEASLGPVP